MARRELVRRLNVEMTSEERPAYNPETVDALVDWISEAGDFDEQTERVRIALERMKADGGRA